MPGTVKYPHRRKRSSSPFLVLSCASSFTFLTLSSLCASSPEIAAFLTAGTEDTSGTTSSSGISGRWAKVWLFKTVSQFVWVSRCTILCGKAQRKRTFAELRQSKLLDSLGEKWQWEQLVCHQPDCRSANTKGREGTSVKSACPPHTTNKKGQTGYLRQPLLYSSAVLPVHARAMQPVPGSNPCEGGSLVEKITRRVRRSHLRVESPTVVRRGSVVSARWWVSSASCRDPLYCPHPSLPKGVVPLQ